MNDFLPKDVAPPREYMDRLLAYQHIKLVKDAILSSIRKGTLEHALAAVADELPMEDFGSLKQQLTWADGLASTFIKNRIRWGTWPEDTGPVMAEKLRMKMREKGLQRSYLTFPEIQTIIGTP